MTVLRVTEPLRPTDGAKVTRWRYRVILNNGRVISLPAFAKALKLPYPSLAKLIHTELAEIGDHSDRFLNIVHRVKQGMRAGDDPRAPRRMPCPACRGKGTIRIPQSLVPEVTSHDDNSRDSDLPR